MMTGHRSKGFDAVEGCSDESDFQARGPGAIARPALAMSHFFAPYLLNWEHPT